MVTMCQATQQRQELQEDHVALELKGRFLLEPLEGLRQPPNSVGSPYTSPVAQEQSAETKDSSARSDTGPGTGHWPRSPA